VLDGQDAGGWVGFGVRQESRKEIAALESRFLD
jgi:hypothetical protein